MSLSGVTIEHTLQILKMIQAQTYRGWQVSGAEWIGDKDASSRQEEAITGCIEQ
jgi:hypothetical protein